MSLAALILALKSRRYRDKIVCSPCKRLTIGPRLAFTIPRPTHTHTHTHTHAHSGSRVISENHANVGAFSAVITTSTLRCKLSATVLTSVPRAHELNSSCEFVLTLLIRTRRYEQTTREREREREKEVLATLFVRCMSARMGRGQSVAEDTLARWRAVEDRRSFRPGVGVLAGAQALSDTGYQWCRVWADPRRAQSLEA